MATLSQIRNRYVLQWVPADNGRRKTLGLAGLRRREAESVCGHVTAIVSSQISRTVLPDATARWLAEVGPRLHTRLVRKGLAQPREGETVRNLADYIDGYIGKRTDLKDGTKTILRRARRSLVDYFGRDRDIARITRGDAADWQRKVKSEYAGATAAMMVKKARQFFAAAIDHELIRDNPFRRLKAGNQANEERMMYVPAADVRKVIDGTPDHEWKLVFALARFAAARIPSEVRNLKWSDLSLDVGKMTLRSPKTEHHEGRASRVVPIDPYLSELLTRAFNAAEEGETYVLPRLRHVTNLTTTAKKLIDRARLAVWVRTFQNLRSSCETDWALKLPIHAACAFAGNTQAVAARHYLQVTDEHFAAVVGAAKNVAAPPGIDRKPTEAGAANPPENTGYFALSVAPEGLELPSYVLSRIGVSKKALSRALQGMRAAAPYMEQAEWEGLRQSLAHRRPPARQVRT